MSSAEQDGLVPGSLADFRSVIFWDGFFRARDQNAFEWYGGWKDLKEVLLPFLNQKGGKTGSQAAILVPGCGNSDLSADLYDQGCTSVVNIDFSRDVIREMMHKSLKQRPEMRWQVMDMLHTKFADGNFSAVVDKGALDALMSDESADADAAVQQYLSEMQRVLNRSSGVFLCITLAQAHTLRNLLKAFRSQWQSQVLPIAPSAATASDELQPVLVVAVRDASSRLHLPVEHQLKPEGRIPNAEQLREAVQVIAEENEQRLAMEQAQASGATAVSSGGLTSEEMQASHRIQDGAAFARLQPGQRNIVHLHLPQDGQKGAMHTTHQQREAPRYTATVVDVLPDHAATARWECCIFIIPQGREMEWLFADAEGQETLANQCGAKRVILISLNRHHKYAGLDAVKSEISSMILPLAPESVRSDPRKIPVTTTEQGVGSRHIAAEVNSPMSGQIVIEDIPAEEKDLPNGAHYSPSMRIRRMVFTSTRSLIQSEALLIPVAKSELSGGNSSSSNGSSRKKKGSSKKGPSIKARERNVAWAIVHTNLMCRYHVSMVQLVMSMLGQGLSLADSGQQLAQCKGLVIGLGGGSLPCFLHEAFGMAVASIELDSVIVDLAKQYFGFPHHLQVEVMDGVEAVARDAEAAPGSLHLLVIDASSGDASLAMTCPPPPFLGFAFLANARKLLAPNGMLIMNCVSRSAVALTQALTSVKAQFNHVWVSEIDDDVNKLLVASQADLRKEAKDRDSSADQNALVRAFDGQQLSDAEKV